MTVQGQQTQSAKPRGQCPRETRHKFPESSPSEVTQDVLNPPSREQCANMCEMLPAQKLVKASAPGLLPGVTPPGNLLPSHTQTADSRQESGGLHQQFGHRKPLIALGAVPTPASQRPAKAQPRKQTFLRRAARPARLTPAGRARSPAPSQNIKEHVFCSLHPSLVRGILYKVKRMGCLGLGKTQQGKTEKDF